eukprot:6211365-Pleurochrysis_carterae.AAC.2
MIDYVDTCWETHTILEATRAQCAACSGSMPVGLRGVRQRPRDNVKLVGASGNGLVLIVAFCFGVLGYAGAPAPTEAGSCPAAPSLLPGRGGSSRNGI